MGKLSIEPLEIRDVYLIKTDAFHDNRGIFARWFCDNELKSIMNGEKIVNVNYSKTITKGSIRGMHFQNPPYTEMKLIRCIRGQILDVIVDIRANSPTFLQHVSVKLSEENMEMLVVPKGFAHGFQSLEDDCEIMYLVSEYYSPEHDSGLNPQDPSLKIEWPLNITNISPKDGGRAFITSSFRGLNI